jgi:L-iditol 2-dehydrogenase
MKVLRLHAPGDLRLGSETAPSAAAGEAILRVAAVGICGSDLHWLNAARIGDARLSRPLVLGHEFAAVVEHPGSPLDKRRVAVDPAISCRTCEYCLEGNPNLCENLRFAGHGADDGALRECLAWPERCLYPLPEAISDEEGALLEPLGVALHAADLGQLRSGMSIGVFGCGPIGLLILQLARLAGATQILATDRLAHRLDAARALGASRTFLVGDGWEFGEVWAATGGRGVHVAFEVAGENHAVETAVASARPGGRVVLVGIPEEDQTTFTASTARRKGLSIQLSRRMKFTYPRALRLVEGGWIDLRALVTHRYRLADYEQAFKVAQRREGLKVLISP